MKKGMIITFSALVFLSVSLAAFCEETKQPQPDRKKIEAEARKKMESDKAVLAFLKKRNVLTGKMFVGFSGEKNNLTAPTGFKVNDLTNSNAAEEFFISIDKTGYYSDQVNMAEGFLPKKKTK